MKAQLRHVSQKAPIQGIRAEGRFLTSPKFHCLSHVFAQQSHFKKVLFFFGNSCTVSFRLRNRNTRSQGNKRSWSPTVK